MNLTKVALVIEQYHVVTISWHESKGVAIWK